MDGSVLVAMSVSGKSRVKHQSLTASKVIISCPTCSCPSGLRDMEI